MTTETLRLHRLLSGTRANGPGMRAAVWTQGCSLSCQGCFNPATHPFGHGAEVSVAEVFRWIVSQPAIEGVTITGGEPLQQRPAVCALLERLRAETTMSAIVLTGFTLEEVRRMPDAERLLSSIDVLVAGRYDRARRVSSGLRGSSNKEPVFLSGRYAPPDLLAVPECEVTILPGGEIIVTGIDPVRLESGRGHMTNMDPTLGHRRS